ncbi:MAG: hypothetical protein JXA71_07230 [Chitinispirillaceae bacterium]|nr:hypothetical protein [Chitinispirillaceae bacterium]
MRNLIRMSVLAAIMLIPGCASTARAGASVSVSVNVGTPFSAWYDSDLDWDNAIVIDNSRIGFWVMLPSGRWVLRCRSMWWNTAYDDWCFGPWYYDYSIAYCNHCYGNYPFPVVRFHVYMHRYYRPWHTRHFTHHSGRYVRHTAVRHHEPARVRQVRRGRTYEQPAVIVKKTKQPARSIQKTAVIVKESKPSVRNDGGTRDTRINNSRGSAGDKQPAMTRSSSSSRTSGNRSGTVTRTQTRRDGRSR